MTTTSLQVNGNTGNLVSQNTDTINREIVEKLVLDGDLSKMSHAQKVDYYVGFCKRLGMDPATKPFMLLKLNGKESLYCDRSGAAQLNKIYNISHTCVAREKLGDTYVVTMRASDKDHYTESTGAVYVGSLKGNDLANAMMKAETKAKRRSTLDLVGLGILDESEISSIKGASIRSIDDVDKNNSIEPPSEDITILGVRPLTAEKSKAMDEDLDRTVNEHIEKIKLSSTLDMLQENFNRAKIVKSHPRFQEVIDEKDRIKAFIVDAQQKITQEMNNG